MLYLLSMRERLLNPYYCSFIEQTEDLLEQGQYRQALALLQNELALPYIPADVQPLLEDLRQRAQAALEPAPRTMRPDLLQTLIEGSEEQQLKACEMLSRLNLRQNEPLVRELLDTARTPIVQGRLIEGLMEQKIDTPFVLERDGLEIDFIPSVVVPADKDPVYHQIREILGAWFADQPLFLEFANTLLEDERLSRLPFDFLEENPAAEAKAIARLIYEGMGMEQEWDAFTEAHGLGDIPNRILTIEKRGKIHEQ